MPDRGLEQLRELARRAADLPVADAIPPAAREFLASVSVQELAAIERFLELAMYAPPHALRPAERLTDAEAVEEWRRLCKRPPEGLA